MSINAPNQDREDYLQRVHKFNVDQLRNIEEKESGNTSDEFGYFISQNVKNVLKYRIYIFLIPEMN